jgi:hypothetical protein
LEAKAHFDSPMQETFVRIAAGDGEIYLDLGDAAWRAVRVNRQGWELVASESLPIRFRRSKGMRALPPPDRAGTLEDLRKAFALSSDQEQFVLLMGVLAGFFSPLGPFCVLCLHGEQGSGKSTYSRMIRSLIDPCQAPLRSAPREEHDLAINASGNWVVALNNLSLLPQWLSDALCRLSTGGGFGTRELYSNDEETVFDYMRPVILNGIEDLATRADLLDRSVLLRLPPILDAARKTESKIWADFERTRSRLLGAILNALSEAMRLKAKAEIQPADLPRMADFALHAEAFCRGLGFKPDEFMEALRANNRESVATAMESNRVASTLLSFMEQRKTEWEGTAQELLDALSEHNQAAAASKNWPKSPQGLSGAVRRAQSNLRRLGVEINFSREPGGGSRRIITITMAPPNGRDSSSQASQASQASQNNGQNGQCDAPSNPSRDRRYVS